MKSFGLHVIHDLFMKEYIFLLLENGRSNSKENSLPKQRALLTQAATDLTRKGSTRKQRLSRKILKKEVLEKERHGNKGEIIYRRKVAVLCLSRNHRKKKHKTKKKK